MIISNSTFAPRLANDPQATSTTCASFDAVIASSARAAWRASTSIAAGHVSLTAALVVSFVDVQTPQTPDRPSRAERRGRGTAPANQQTPAAASRAREPRIQRNQPSCFAGLGDHAAVCKRQLDRSNQRRRKRRTPPGASPSTLCLAAGRLPRGQPRAPAAAISASRISESAVGAVDRANRFDQALGCGSSVRRHLCSRVRSRAGNGVINPLSSVLDRLRCGLHERRRQRPPPGLPGRMRERSARTAASCAAISWCRLSASASNARCSRSSNSIGVHPIWTSAHAGPNFFDYTAPTQLVQWFDASIG